MAAEGGKPSSLRIGGWLPPPAGDQPTPDAGPASPAARENPAAAGRPARSAAPPPPGPPPPGPAPTRRRPARSASRRFRAAIVVAAVAAVAAAVAVPVVRMLAAEPPPPVALEPVPTVPWPEPDQATAPAGATPPATTPPATAPAPRPTATTKSPARRPPVRRAVNRTPRPDGGSRSAGATPRRPAPVNLSLEAESSSNEFSGTTRPWDNDAASRGRLVRWVGNGSGNTLGVAVTVPDAGTYTVTLYYISESSREAVVRANGGRGTRLTFPGTGDWETVRALTVRLPLRAGRNTVELGNPDYYAPDFDRVTVTR